MNLTYAEAIEIYHGLTQILQPKTDADGKQIPFDSDKETRHALIHNSKLLKKVAAEHEEKRNEIFFSITGFRGAAIIQKGDPKMVQINQALAELNRSNIPAEISDNIIPLDEEKLKADENKLGIEIVAISNILKESVKE